MGSGDRRSSNTSLTLTENKTNHSDSMGRWRLSRDDIKFNLWAQKLLIWLKFLPLESDETGGRLWVPSGSAYWKRVGFRNIWMGYASLRLLVLIMSVAWGQFGSVRRVKSYELSLDLMAIFVFVLLFHGYAHLVLFDLPSQTILSNQLLGCLSTGKRNYFQKILKSI